MADSDEKPTKARRSERTRWIRQAVLNGLAPYVIADEGHRRFGITRRQMRTLIKQEHERIAAVDADMRAYERSRAVARFDRLAHIAEQRGDLRTALAAIEKSASLLGLDAPAVVKVEHDGFVPPPGGELDDAWAQRRILQGIAENPTFEAQVRAAIAKKDGLAPAEFEKFMNSWPGSAAPATDSAHAESGAVTAVDETAKK